MFIPKTTITSKAALLMLSLIMCAALLGCGVEPPISGGKVVRSSEPAPYSGTKNMLEFSTNFYLWGIRGMKPEGRYRFTVTRGSDGTIQLKEDCMYKDLCCEADESVFAGIQKIIDENNLSVNNGVYRYTAGLPEECQPCSLYAGYEDGEKLEFTTDNNPEAGWSTQLRDYFAEIFAAHGIDDLLPPVIKEDITRFDLEIINKDEHLRFGELRVPREGVEKSFEELVMHGYADDECFTVIEQSVYDRTLGEETKSVRALPGREYYDGLKALTRELDFVSLANYESEPTDFDYDATQQYYSFYAEYESGDRLYGFSSDAAEYEKALPVLTKIAEYISGYTEQNSIDD